MTADPLLETLSTGLTPTFRRLERRRLAALAKALRKSLPPTEGDAGIRLSAVVAFLLHRTGEILGELQRLESLNGDFLAYHAQAVGEAERRQVALDFAAALGAGRVALARDRRAFKRWFDFDAVVERCHSRMGNLHQELAFLLERLGVLAGKALADEGPKVGYARLWQRLDLEAPLLDLLTYRRDGRIPAKALVCLRTALADMPDAERPAALSESTVRFVYRTALDHRRDLWCQCEALALLRLLDSPHFAEVVKRRLAAQSDGDDFFARRRALMLAAEHLTEEPGLVPVLADAAADPSAYVRQGLADSLPRLPDAEARQLHARLALQDPEPAVRLAAFEAAPSLAKRPTLRQELVRTFLGALTEERATSVLRGILASTEAVLIMLQAAEAPAAQAWYEALAPTVQRLHRSAPSPAVRRFAAQAAERLWCRHDPRARTLFRELAPFATAIPAGGSRRLPAAFRESRDEALLGRVLSVIAQDDFGYEVVPGLLGPRLRRGPEFRFRLWRLLHELRYAAVDKRQAHPHLIGRVYRGRLQAPSALLGELSQTKVPGEPLFLEEEGGWRPYLPLLDQILSVLDDGRPARIFTSEGVTEIAPPAGLLRQLRAKARLSLRFADLAALRNWTSRSPFSAKAFLERLGGIGLKIRLQPYRDRGEADGQVLRFFPAGLPPSLLPLFDGRILERFHNYALSAYQNGLKDLAIFVLASVLLFLAHHAYLVHRLTTARRAIPLVIGGWGTRGKSGTERLKAAVFNALGFPLVSKTTGCEAMFLHAPPMGEITEMFLFRPYDKATIWEQCNVTRLAHDLDAEVLLWECMGLSPVYVRILQRQWMRDDVATLTNCYPDHEDLQGPAGYNIAEVMTNFIPKGATCLTSEEQMRPILAEEAVRLKTRMISVGWAEAARLTPDLLARFPYAEHPYNIALVLALIRNMGLAEDFALKEMADRVVPDLGVLKTFAIAEVGTRRLQFVNGMSANERFGCLANWQRTGFDRQDPYAEPGIWISTVVNNRADRVPRSRVFASILVNDIAADCHVLIGNNLEGLRGFVEEALDARLAETSLWPRSGGESEPGPLARLEEAARQLRQPFAPAHLLERLVAMGLERSLAQEALRNPERLAAALQAEEHPEAAAILRHHRQDLDSLTDYEALRARLERSQDPDKSLDEAFRDYWRQRFLEKIVVVADYHASGDAIIRQIAEVTPPAYLNRIMGIQNIKGTGLDFAYRWQAWEKCDEACRLMEGNDPGEVARGLQALGAFREHGPLSEARVRGALAQLRQSALFQSDEHQGSLALIEDALEAAAHSRESAGDSGKENRVLANASTMIEALIDAGDALKRRRTADRIYRDLADGRISHPRAQRELQAINKRQKGGWLRQSLLARQEAMAARAAAKDADDASLAEPGEDIEAAEDGQAGDHRKGHL